VWRFNRDPTEDQREIFIYDLAIIELNQDAHPAIPRYPIYTGNAELNHTTFPFMDFVGYGATGTGLTGASLQAGTKRDGKNRFDAFVDELDPVLVAEGTNRWGPPGLQLAFDFDDGGVFQQCTTVTPTHPGGTCDAMGYYLQRPHLGFSTDEVMVGGGDSGGPSFIYVDVSGTPQAQIAGVHQGWIYPTKTDINPNSGSHFGEIGVDSRVSAAACWISNVKNGITDTPPAVAEVSVRSSYNHHNTPRSGPPFINPVPGVVGSGWRVNTVPTIVYGSTRAWQLQTIPVAKPDMISIQFTEDINEALIETLQSPQGEKYFEAVVVNSNPTIHLYPTAVDYVSATRTATWAFGTPLAQGSQARQITIRLKSSIVQGSSGQILDSEWFNPTHADDTRGSAYPSGDGCPDEGTTAFFEFNVTLVPADFNGDNIVDGSDFNIWNANKFTDPHATNAFVIGDANGDDVVDGSDFGIWNSLKFTSWKSWPTGGSQSMAGGGGASQPSTSWLLRYNDLLRRHHIFHGNTLNQTLSLVDWQRFSDDLFRLLGEL
jgi:hypothetical protein